MRHGTVFAIALALVVAFVVVVAGPGVAIPGAEVGIALSDFEVTCPADELADGGPVGATPAQIKDGDPLFNAFACQNTSTTCVRLGGSTVTQSRGISLGSGCAAGEFIPVDARDARCVADGTSAITIDCVGSH